MQADHRNTVDTVTPESSLVAEPRPCGAPAGRLSWPFDGLEEMPVPIRWLSALLVSIVLSACASGEEPDQHAAKAAPLPAWTSPKSRDPAAAEFREVVELCATRPDTPAFNNRWSRFIGRYHEPGLDVAAVVDQVIRQAEARRQELPKDPRWMAPAVSSEAIREQMLAVAETALSGTGDSP